MCGIIGIISSKEVSSRIVNSLKKLEYRGYDSAGIATLVDGNINEVKCEGRVDVLEKDISKFNLKGDIGIGHVRYPTEGDTTRKEIQPFSISRPYGISLVHNGNITNKSKLEKFLIDNNLYLNSTSDSEVLLNLFYYFIEKHIKLNNDIIVKAIYNIYEICEGSFSVIIMINDYGLITFRDKYGIRPLVYSENDKHICIASETIGLPDHKYYNVNNGEIIIINNKLEINKYCYSKHEIYPCIFEYIYFSSPQSYINDILVYKFREKAGEIMIKTIKDNIPLDMIDIVVPVPCTSLISATTISNILQKPLVHGILKNRYTTNRTFINSGNNIITEINKINIITDIVKDKNILIVDDSIVRGNTIKYIITKLKKASVKNIYFCSCSPPIRYPNIYGIYLPNSNELFAYNKTVDQLRETLNINKLLYLSLNDILNILRSLNPNIENFETSTFTGKYII